MDPQTTDLQLPKYLQTLADFRAYLDDEFGDQTGASRGRRFMQAMLLLLPHLPQSDGFESFTASPTVSHDGGVDISSKPNPDGSILRVQSKYKLARVDDLDTVISKFKDFDDKDKSSAPPAPLFDLPNDKVSDRTSTFMLLTASDVEGIRGRYEDSRRPSLAFYQELRKENRIHLIGGLGILEVLRHRFMKSSRLPASLALTSSSGWIRAGDVYLGIVRGPSIVELFDRHGDGLFFENIREWLGLEEGRVNHSISATIREAPNRMLERNNGLTVRGEKVRQIDDNTLMAERAAIINGCQTTMCLWHARPTDPDLLVQVKVVQTPANEDAWTIARSANYQNDVSQIDLELAKFLRPQLVSRVAAAQGKGLATARSDSLSGLLAELSETEVTYALTKYVFLGLFCSPPNQLFRDNYSKLRMDVLKHLYEIDPSAEDKLFSAIFRAVEAGRRANTDALQTYSGDEYASLYTRLLDTKRPKYSAYLVLLAGCGALRMDLSDRNSQAATEADRVNKYLTDLANLIQDEPERFEEAYLIAFKVVAGSVNRIEEEGNRLQQHMSGRVTESSFTNLWRTICMELDGLERLIERRSSKPRL